MANLCDGHGTIVRERVDAGGAYQTPAGQCEGCTLCTFVAKYRAEKQAPCSCTTSEHPGWSIDENWQCEDPRAYAQGRYERAEYDGLIPCGWCDGDLWCWVDVTTPDDLRAMANDMLILAEEVDG